MENLETTKKIIDITPIVSVSSKKYLILASVIMAGAISHAIEDARQTGWKGLVWFTANIFVAGFVGMIFSQVVSMMNPDWMYAAGGVGGYMGPAAFKYIQSATLNRLGIPEKQK